MNKNLFRILVIITGVITALIHLFLGFRSLNDNLGIPFILNGISYLVLVYAVVAPPSFLEGRESLMHYLLMAFAALTIVLWYFLNGDFSDPIGLVTKIDEILLIIFTWLHLRSAS
jgi:hypothetical protein